MWRAVNTLVRRPYTYSESKDVAGILKRFSVRETAEPTPTAASTPPALSRLLQVGSTIVGELIALADAVVRRRW